MRESAEQMVNEQPDDKASDEKRRIAAMYGRAAGTFDRVGPRFFGYFGQRLVERAGIRAGERVLDVGCGRGAALLPAGEAVGERGLVVGIDLSKEMVKELANEVQDQDRTNVGVCLMDAERLHFPDESFDCVTCGFALFFFPRLDKALSEMRRVLKPGGRIAVTTWDKAGAAAWQWYRDLVKTYLPVQPPRVGGQGPVFDEPDGLKAILIAAQFKHLQLSAESFESVYRSEEEWWSTLWSHGWRANLEKIEAQGGAEALARFKADALRGLQRMKHPDGIHEVSRAICAVGRK